MPKLTDQQLANLIQAGATDEEILALSQEGEAAPESGGYGGMALAAGGAAAAGLGALALKNPGMLKTAGQGLMDLRRMSMLSGLAPLKSLLGNVGGAAYSSIERMSPKPLREMLSPTTAREAVQAFKEGTTYADSPATALSKYNLPGRFMGAMDTASQSALQRAGLTSAEAAKEMLQAPLGKGSLTESLMDNPVADYFVPFRRTPFNQLSEGFNSMKPSYLKGNTGAQAALATSLGTGAATGYLADDPKLPVALGVAASGRRGLPFALAAGAGRALRSGNGRDAQELVTGMSPVSDYSLAEGATKPFIDPLHSVIPKPKAYDWLKQLFGVTP